MDMSSLSVPDLSLFCMDLLPMEIASVGSSVVDEETLKSLLLDGIKRSDNEPWSPMKAPSDDFISFDAHDSGLGEELFGASWLDTKVDLLDLLEDPAGVDPVAPPMVQPESVAEKPDFSSAALQVLQSLAEATTQMLADEEGPDNLVKEECPANFVKEECPANFVKEEPSPTIATRDLRSMGLMDLLTTEFVESSVLEPELDFSLLSEPILSPVTAEDVESLLSSGPSSPVSQSISSETAASLFNEIEREIDMDLGGEVSVLEESLVSSDSFIEVPHIIITPQATFENESDPESSESFSDDEYIPPSAGKVRGGRQRQTPYARPNASNKPLDRKQRKKQQNKDAATRYRQKKKAEQDAVNGEFDGLMMRNTELKGQVEQMTREIQYLKDLMADVYRAKGILKPKA